MSSNGPDTRQRAAQRLSRTGLLSGYKDLLLVMYNALGVISDIEEPLKFIIAHQAQRQSASAKAQESEKQSPRLNPTLSEKLHDSDSSGSNYAEQLADDENSTGGSLP